MGDMALITSPDKAQGTQAALLNKPQKQSGGEENQDLFALLFQSLTIFGQGQLSADNVDQSLINGDGTANDSAVADLLSFNHNLDWQTFSLLNGLNANKMPQLEELQSLLDQVTNGSELNAKISEILNVFDTSKQPQDDLLKAFNNLTKEEQQSLYNQLKIVVELGLSDTKSFTNVHSNLNLKENSLLYGDSKELLEKYSEDIKAFIKLIEKEFNLKPDQIDSVIKDLSKIKPNNEIPQSFNDANIQSILKGLNSNQQITKLFSEQFPDINVGKELDITSLESTKLVIQNINLNTNNVDNSQMVNKQQVAEKLNTGQNFVSDLGKVVIKNIQLPNGATETKIQLLPQELGQIDVKISANNGQISATFIAETAMGKELLDSQISQLKNSLVQQGFQVDKIEIQQQQQASSTNTTSELKGSFNFSGQQSARQQSNGQAYYQANTYSDEPEEFNKELLSLSGIDYTV